LKSLYLSIGWETVWRWKWNWI